MSPAMPAAATTRGPFYAPGVFLLADARAAEALGEGFLREHQLVPLTLQHDSYVVAAVDPQAAVIQDLRRTSGRPVEVMVSTRPEIELALDTIFRPAAVGGVLWRNFARLLVSIGFLSHEQTLEVLRAGSTDRRPLDEVLLEKGYLDEESIAEAKSLLLYLPWVRLDAYRLSPALAPVIPASLAQRLEVIPLFAEGTSLVIAGPNWLRREALVELEEATGLYPRQAICTRSAFKAAFQQAYGKALPEKEKKVASFAEALLKGGFASRSRLQSAQAIQSATGEPLERVLVRLGHLNEEGVLAARAFQVGVDWIRLDGMPVPEAVGQLIPEPLSRRYRCVAFAKGKSLLSVAMADPLHTEAIGVLSQLTGLSIKPFLCPEGDVEAARERVYASKKPGERKPPLRAFPGPSVRGRYLSREQPRSPLRQKPVTRKGVVGAAGPSLDFVWINLERYRLLGETVLLIPEEMAREHCLIAVYKEDYILTVAMADPWDEEGIGKVEEVTGLATRVVVAARSAIESAIQEYYTLEAPQWTLAVKEFANYLVHQGALSPDQLREVWRRCITAHVPFDVAVSELGFLPPEQVALALAQYRRMEYVDLSPYEQVVRVFDAIGQPAESRRWFDPVEAEVARLVTEETARSLMALPIGTRGRRIVVALANPLDATALEELQRILSRPILPVVSTRDQVLDAIRRTIGRKSLGDRLLEAGIITRKQLDEALNLHRKVGVRIGMALTSLGYVTQQQLSNFLAQQHGIPFFDLSGAIIDEQVARALPEELERQNGLLPVHMDEESITIAMVDPLNESAIQEVAQITGLQVRPVLTTEDALDQAMEAVYRGDYLAKSATELVFRYPEESAYQVLSLPQKLSALFFLAASAVLAAWNYVFYFLALNALVTLYYTSSSIYKLYLIYRALAHTLEIPASPEEVAALDERDLPTYTILIPLYREAAVVPRLIRSIDALDYPNAKLDVKLLLEEDDRETIAAILEHNLPPHIKPVIVPDAPPKGKPKACNYGLIHAEGEYVVIYDAEDIPEPDQLKKAIVAFRKADESVVCIQAKLNYYNRDQNILTRWFTAEYSMWFDLFLPGLDATDVPIPLGGTSNHFPTRILQELGAWDPHNVTEDADLGMRLYKVGWKTAVMDSTTFEEANSRLYNWIRQRSRWVKGYIQTYLVHMRHPFRLWRHIGTRPFFSFNLVVGGTVFSFLVNPIYWTLTALWFLTQWGLIRELYPPILFYVGAFSLYVGNFVFVYLNVAGCLRRRYYDMVKYALLSPIYWALMSMAAWKGLLQLFYKPSYWEKTNHGLYEGEPMTAPARDWRELFIGQRAPP